MEAVTIKAVFRRLQRDDVVDTVEVISKWLRDNLDKTDPDTEITVKIGI